MAISGDYEYEIINDDEVEITGYNGSDTEVIIPDEIDGMKVTSLGYRAFLQSDIVEVVFPKYLKKTEPQVFRLSTNLKKVTLNQRLEYIDYHLFEAVHPELEIIWLASNVEVHNGFYAIGAAQRNHVIRSYSNNVINAPNGIRGFNVRVEDIPEGEYYVYEFVENNEWIYIELPKDITSIHTQSSYTTDIGQYVDLPEHVTVDLNNGETYDAIVNWDDIPKEEGTHTVNGTLSLPGDIRNPNNLQPTIEVEVLQLNVVEVETLNDVSIDYGEDYEPPNQLLVAYGGGSIDDNNYINMACANWEQGYRQNFDNPSDTAVRTIGNIAVRPSATYKLTSYGDYRVVVNLNNEDGYTNRYTVMSNDAITFTTREDTQSINLYFTTTSTTGESISPEMVGKELKVKLTTGNDSYTTNRTEITDVSWGEYDELAEGKQTIKGDLLIRDIYKNTDDLQAEYKITVEKREVVSIDEIANLEVDYTTSFDIPSEVEITLDNDEVLSVDVIDLERTKTTHSDAYFTHTYEYKLNVPEEYIYTDATYSFTIKVNKRYITAVNSISDRDVSFGTPFNELQLQSSTNVELSDGSIKRYNIVWDSSGYIPSLTEAQTINGDIVVSDDDITVNKDNLQASITLNVQEPYVESKQPEESQEIYIFDKDDKFLNVLSVDNGLISTYYKEYVNEIPDEPFKMEVDSESELISIIKEENQLAFYVNVSALGVKEKQLKLFRIKEVDERYDGMGYIVEVFAEPSYLELYDHFIEDRRIDNGNVQTALDRALEGSRWIGQSFLSTTSETTNFYWINAMEALEKIVDTWGGVLTDVIVLDSKNDINYKAIYLVPRLGSENGLLIQPDYNAETIERRTLSYPITGVWGQGASLELEDDEGNATGGHSRYITFEDVEWKKSKGDPVDKPKGQKWVGDPEALVKYGYKEGNSRKHRFGHFSNQDYETPEELLFATWEYLQANKHPEVTYVFEIHETEKPIFLGDTVVALDRHYGKPIEVQAEISGLEYDILRPDDKTIIVGDHKSLRDPTDDIIGDMNDRLDGVENRPSRVDENSYPNKKPSTPIEVIAEGGYRNIDLYWRYTDEIYVKKYEVYGSTIKDFAPSENNLLWSGDVSAMTHTADMDETWYFRVAAVNYHNKRSEYSAQVSASTARDISPDILFGSIKAEQLEDMLDLAGKLDEGTLDWIADDTIERIDVTQLGIEEMINDITSSLANDIAHLQNRADGIEGDVTTVFSELDDIEGRFTQVINNISNIDGVIEEHESLIEQNEQAILERVTHSELNSVENEFSQSIAEVETRANEISNRVTQVNTRIDNIDLSGTNFITHLPGNWEQGYVGTSSGNNLTSPIRVRVKDYYRIDGNQEYTLSSYGDYSVVIIIFTESSNTPIANFRTDNDDYVTFTTPQNARRFRVHVVDANSDNINPDMIGTDIKVKLSLGNEESGWTPNLDDTGELVSQVQTYVAEFTIRADSIEQTVASIEEDIDGIHTQFTTIEQEIDNVLIAAKSYTEDELGNVTDEIISYINVSPEGIAISGDRIRISGQTEIENGVIGTAAIANAAIDKAHLKNAIIDNVHINNMSGNKLIVGSVNADKLNVSNLSAVSSNLGTVTAGILRSRNDNMELNLNTGSLLMQRAYFTLGSGARIEFTSTGNRIQYRDVKDGVVRSAGFGVGKTTSDLPFAYSGTTGDRDLDTLSPYYSGAIWQSTRAISDGAYSSINGNRLAFRNNAVGWNKGLYMDWFGNNPSIETYSPTTYNYTLGTFYKIYGKQGFNIQNYTNRRSGWILETTYAGDGTDITFRGQYGADYNYQIGSSSSIHRIRNIYLRNNPNVSSDKRLKEDINDLDLGLDFINKINVVRYRLKPTNADLKQGTKRNKIQYGVIAQQVLSVLNEFGAYDTSIITGNETDMYGASYEQFIAPTIKAIQELDSKFETRVSKLERENKRLKERIEILEAA